jgi:hypothetical protein
MKLRKILLKKLVFFAFCCTSLYGIDSINLLRDFDKDLHKEFLESRREVIDKLIFEVSNQIDYYGALSEAADWRQALAKLQNSMPWDSFGKVRGEPAISNLETGGGKAHIEKIDLILKKVKKKENHPFMNANIYYEYLFYGDIDGKKIPLTCLLYLDRTDYYEKLKSENLIANKWKTIKKSSSLDGVPVYSYHVIHTEPEFLDLVHDHLSEIWDKVLYKKNQKNKIELIAQFHWWFANAMPFDRGSAAIGEVLAETLLKGAGFKWEKKKHLLIDIEALLEPNMDEFVRQYPSFHQIL